MLADIQVACSVVGHAVALITWLANLFDTIRGAPPAAHISGHVAEVQALFLRIPDGAFRKPEARAKFLDSRILINQLEHLGRFDFDGFSGIIHSVFAPPEHPSSSGGRTRSALAQPNFQFQLYLCAKLYAARYRVSNWVHEVSV